MKTLFITFRIVKNLCEIYYKGQYVGYGWLDTGAIDSISDGLKLSPSGSEFLATYYGPVQEKIKKEILNEFKKAA